MKTKSLRYVYDLGGYRAREDGNIQDHEGNILKVYADGTVFVRPDFMNWQRIPAHRLIAIAFVPNPEDFSFVLFKDGDKTNRKPENLYWSPSKRPCTTSRDPITREVLPNKAERIKELRRKGVKVAEIAQIVGSTTQYVYRVLDKLPARS